MSSAGNTDLPRSPRIDPIYLVVFVLLFTGFFTLINVASATLGFQESLPQRFLTALNTASFTTLIATLILHTIYQNRNTVSVLLISCGVFIVSYYSYVIFKALSKGLAIIPYPLLIELRGSSNSAYVIDLPQIIVISLLAYYTYRKHRRFVSQSTRETITKEPLTT
ncbi:MAG: hypothetical protein ACP5KB_02835 [Thermoprotei archaeon]